MGKAEPLRWLGYRYLSHGLQGLGLEIGALWRRFPVHPAAKVFYMDRAHPAHLKAQFTDLPKPIFLPDLIADASELPLAPHSLNFLIASHVLEHLPLPLAALRAWYDALAPGGKLLVKVPDKRSTFDRGRERTPLSHLTAEHDHPEQTDWQTHHAEFVTNVHRRKPTEAELTAGAEGLRTGTFNIHFHAWIDDDILQIIDFTQRVWNLDRRPRVFWNAHSWRKEVTVLLQRVS